MRSIVEGMNEPLLICCDMDRTLLPNGEQPESPLARPLFARMAARPGVQLGYVTGRHLALALDAIRRYRVPLPDYLVCDVGTSIYSLQGEQWQLWEEWSEHLAEDWRGSEQADLAELFADLRELTLQEPVCQARFKLSYYAAAEVEPQTLLRRMRERLTDHAIRAELIWSVDETTGTGLLDLIPLGGSKRHAVEYLMVYSGAGYERTLFAGDSGNDLPVLISPIQSVLVANATETVRSEALRRAAEAGNLEALYTARGGYLGMNGNYSAGILEGASRRYPELRSWLEATEEGRCDR